MHDALRALSVYSGTCSRRYFLFVLHAALKLVNTSKNCSSRILTVTTRHSCRSHASPCDSMQPMYTTSCLLSCTLCSLAIASPADLCNLYFRRVQARTSHAFSYGSNLLTSQFVFAEFQWQLYLSQVKKDEVWYLAGARCLLAKNSNSWHLKFRSLSTRSQLEVRGLRCTTARDTASPN